MRYEFEHPSYHGTHRDCTLLYFLFGTDLAAYRRDRRRQYFRLACKVIKKLERLAGQQEINCLGMLLLLVAERKSLHADVNTGKKAYERAISQFARTGFTHFAAIAFERAGEFSLQRGDTFWAKHYLCHAVDKYDEWGASVKVGQLHRLYPFIEDRRNIVPEPGVVMSFRGREQFDSTKDSHVDLEPTKNDSKAYMKANDGDRPAGVTS